MTRAPSGALAARTLPVPSLPAAARDAMWRLFSATYAGVTRPTFEADLAAKRDVILLEDTGDASLQGFSTLVWYRRAVAGRRVVAVFSGDTVIAPGYWGQTALQRAFLRYAITVKLRHPRDPVYWLLISKGYRTYLLLTRNFPEHWPRHDRPTPPWQRAVIAQLATERWGAAFDPARGVLRMNGRDGRLQDGVAPIDEGLLGQPDIAFFDRQNPGHAQGDELCCLGRIDARLWASYMGKLARRRLLGPRSR